MIKASDHRLFCQTHNGCSHLQSVSDDSDLPYHEDAPDLNAVYRWELDAQLADTAGHLQNGRGKHLANGWSQDDAWLDALGDVSYVTSLSMASKASRQSHCCESDMT